ncbi:MarR family winged helix-turn-helix transcriptional regulator [uncultured Microbacterium sp.]|uniref:MarR family winged helix-turn-helix transcriptional regulator n=1 Tax=uncultured Microbacterium sp. TaxID=191216 RepID=UPI0025F8D448|nr:MarR family winged helix-turn-helix transcriptional regulator [uncultured Microbacterium sp.]
MSADITRGVPTNDPGLEALEALRTFAHAYQESSRQLAEWMSLPHTDGAGLGEVVWAERRGAPLSPARLCERIGLTSGATSALIGRLEQRELVGRHRESTDRRVVTLRATEQALTRLGPFLQSASERLRSAMSGADPDALREVARTARTLALALPRSHDVDSGSQGMRRLDSPPRDHPRD